MLDTVSGKEPGSQKPVPSDIQTKLDNNRLVTENKIMKRLVAVFRKKITRHVNTAGTASTNISLGIRSRTRDGTNKLVNIDDDTNLKTTNPTFKSRAWSAMGLIPPKNYLKSNFGAKAVSVWSGGTIQDASKSGNIVKKGFVALFTSKPMQGLIHTLDYVGDRLDFFDVAMTFTDAFYYCRPDQTDCPLPDISELLSGAIFNNIARKSLEYQKTALIAYNQQVDNFNSVVQDDGWPRVYEKFPLITGPLDVLDAKNANGDPYWIQQRVQTEIDAIRLKYLKDSSKPYLAALLDEVNGIGQDIYNQVVADPTDSLLYYIEGTDGVFSASMLDSLYREAFTAVCTYNGGIVYEDVYPTQDAGGNPVMSGRPRFQCGWSSTNCNKKAVEWMKLYEGGIWPVGNYAEWFSFEDPDIAAVNPIPADSPLRSGSKTGACMITNSGSHGMCREYKGTYNFTTRRCEYTKEYCQSLGTCFNTTTKTCYLPADAMKAVSFFFGTGGPREFIKVHGCTFAGGSGQNMDQFVAVSGLAGIMSGTSRMFADAIKNVRNWGPGLRDTLGNPIGSLGFSSSVLGIAAFAGAGPLAAYGSLLVGIGAGIAAGVDAANATLTRQKSPTGDVREYHIGGLETPSGALEPTIKAATLGDGWITKPLQIFPNGTAFSVRNIPGIIEQRFFRDFDGSVDLDTYLRFGGSDYQNTCWTLNPPMIRAASDSGANKEWCIPAKPDATAFTDANVGELITEETYLYNRMWTDGKDPWYPSTVIGNMPFGPDRQNLWYYQLVYDREKMKVASTTTSSAFSAMTTSSRTYTVASAGDFTVGNIIDLDSSTALGITGIASVSALTATTLTLSFTSQSIGAQNPTTPVTIKGTMPLVLWNDTVLKKYFDAPTISSMRQYYCTNAFYADLTGSSIDKKCFGYLDVITDKYNVRKMSVQYGHSRSGVTPICSVTPADGQKWANPGVDCTVTACTTAGSYCTGGIESRCTTCVGGTFESIACSTIRNTVCATCTSGYYCPVGSTSETPCSVGNYCPSGSASQSPCPAGYFCPQPWQRIQCNPTNYCPAGSTSEDWCPAGYYCSTTTTKTQCSAGYSCPRGSTSQTICPITIASGSIWVNPGIDCTIRQCNAGYYCPNSTTETACDGFYYCPTGSTSQTLCPAGYYCTTPSTKTQCPAGSYCSAGSIQPTSCSPITSGYLWTNPGINCNSRQCTAGNYCPIGSTSETPCTSGDYCPAGSSSKTQCPAGSYCSTTTTITACSAGYSCPAGSTSQTACAKPVDGQKWANPGVDCTTNTCTVPGTFCTGGVQSFCSGSCGAGNYVSTACTTSSDRVCKTCDAGYYCSDGTNRVACTTSGYYCPAGSTSATGTACATSSCAANMTLSGCGGSSPGTCVCKSGTVSIPPGSVTCVPTPVNGKCSVGEYVATWTDGTQYCWSCGITVGSGYIWDNAGVTCTTKQCPAGSYCPNSTTQTACTSGNYCLAGSISQKTCTATCSAGTYESRACTTSQNRVCTTCSSGSSSVANSTFCFRTVGTSGTTTVSTSGPSPFGGSSSINTAGSLSVLIPNWALSTMPYLLIGSNYFIVGGVLNNTNTGQWSVYGDFVDARGNTISAPFTSYTGVLKGGTKGT